MENHGTKTITLGPSGFFGNVEFELSFTSQEYYSGASGTYSAEKKMQTPQDGNQFAAPVRLFRMGGWLPPEVKQTPCEEGTPRGEAQRPCFTWLLVCALPRGRPSREEETPREGMP